MKYVQIFSLCQKIEQELEVLNYLKNLVEEHAKLTKSKYSKKILYEWDINIDKFMQVCPIEMLDKLDHPITNKVLEKKAG